MVWLQEFVMLIGGRDVEAFGVLGVMGDGSGVIQEEMGGWGCRPIVFLILMGSKCVLIYQYRGLINWVD